MPLYKPSVTLPLSLPPTLDWDLTPAWQPASITLQEGPAQESLLPPHPPGPLCSPCLAPGSPLHHRSTEGVHTPHPDAPPCPGPSMHQVTVCCNPAGLRPTLVRWPAKLRTETRAAAILQVGSETDTSFQFKRGKTIITKSG